MQLKDFNRKQLERIAEKANTTVEYLLQIKYGKRRPSPDLALKIEEATNGAIDRMQLLYPTSEDPVETEHNNTT